MASKEENLEILGNELGIDIELIDTEVFIRHTIK